jgi:hypothetical protein
MAKLGNETLDLEGRVFVLDLAGDDNDGVHPGSVISRNFGMQDRFYVMGEGTRDSVHYSQFVTHDDEPEYDEFGKPFPTSVDLRALEAGVTPSRFRNYNSDFGVRLSRLRELGTVEELRVMYEDAKVSSPDKYLDDMTRSVNEKLEDGSSVPVVVVATYLLNGYDERDRESAKNLVEMASQYDNAVVVLMGPEKERENAPDGIQYVTLHDWPGLSKAVSQPLLRLEKGESQSEEEVAPYRVTVRAVPLDKADKKTTVRVYPISEMNPALVAMRRNG